MSRAEDYAILKAIRESGGAWSSRKNAGGTFQMQSAFNNLYNNEYITAMGKDWNTAVITLTAKGREYLKELEETE